jgi:hypothetical protein
MDQIWTTVCQLVIYVIHATDHLSHLTCSNAAKESNSHCNSKMDTQTHSARSLLKPDSTTGHFIKPKSLLLYSNLILKIIKHWIPGPIKPDQAFFTVKDIKSCITDYSNIL